MATNVVPFDLSQLPSFAKNAEVNALTNALAGGSAQTGKRISLANSAFHLIVDGKKIASVDERYLDVVIVNAAPKISRTFYATEYKEGNTAAPTCWSQNGDTPAPECVEKQAPQCATCPQNEKGSGKGDTKACSYNQRLAVVLANDIEGDLMMLQLASKSIFGDAENGQYPLQAYARFLKANKTNANCVITRMKFDPAAQSKLFFKPMRWLTPEEYAIVAEKGESEEAHRYITLTVSQTDGVAAQKKREEEFSNNEPPAPAPKASKKPAPLPPEEDDEPPAPAPKKSAPAPADDEAPAPEPTKRKPASKEAPEVPGKGKLADVIAGWDDED